MTVRPLPSADVTVIVPHYECWSLLPRALESIDAQSLATWHCVVVDDASTTPPGARLTTRFSAARFTWLKTTSNVGQFRIYNALLPFIRSPYVLLQDADDWSVSHRLERLLEAAHRWRSSVIGSAVARVSSAGKVVGHIRPPLDVNRALRWRFRRRVFFGSTMLCRTETLRALGGFDGTTRVAGDSDFIYRAVFAARVHNHQDALYFYMDRPASLTRSPSTGFGSRSRRLYAHALRRRFYRSRWRSTLGLSIDMRAAGNDMDARLVPME